MKYAVEELSRNDEALYRLRDSNCGKRCFVLGNGPSLKIADVDRLVDEITFASNRIYLAFEETEWRPTYYTLCDAVVARSNENMIRSLQLPKIFSGSVRDVFHNDPRAIFPNFPRPEDEGLAKLGSDGVRRIAPPVDPASGGAALESIADVKDDLTMPLYWNFLRGAKAGHSVVNLGIKAAYWMGIREIYVIGCDHNFVVPEKKTGEVVFNNEVVVSEGEINHFHKDYRRPGETWTMPQLDTIAEEFLYARRVLEADSGTIKNASRTTKLEVWERVEFDDLF